ncbi:tyrosine-type recombinase/integrase [Leptospira alstonii]|uniref:Site-specific tyrosine recombinase XerC n=2 Tax=Leptospira alstonii TaxID=28452 RepID=T0FY00_9LEPT|nr:tyrosine-type recombinase/integrase [Leptospira alstonii]EMJ92324.1 putative site-specific tyrosine recombinase XerC [Leptospira alstonii serovar Sichuan str. 79601]EQA78877.1 putative site-specific tyrosine recombinase XerC [Leptospira alstonii serovar Pingchang str. 80-412]
MREETLKITDGKYHLHGFTLKGRESELEKRILEYLQSQERIGRTVKTLKHKRIALKVYYNWSEERGLTNPEETTQNEIEGYQRYLRKYRNQVTRERIGIRTSNSWLCTLRSYYLYLERKGYIRRSPCLEMKLPRKGRRIPRNVLSVEEVESILSVPDWRTSLGIRNRAILELFYSTGIRLFELKRLEIGDIDFSKKRIFVREGKGKKDRVIPISKRALYWLEKYLEEVRLGHVKGSGNYGLFLSCRGTVLQSTCLIGIVREALEKAGVEKKGATHMFRHTTATLMLENGADIRYVQEMLGHKDLNSTQIYTHVAIRKLKEVYESTHPSAGHGERHLRKANINSTESDTS